MTDRARLHIVVPGAPPRHPQVIAAAIRKDVHLRLTERRKKRHRALLWREFGKPILQSLLGLGVLYAGIALLVWWGWK